VKCDDPEGRAAKDAAGLDGATAVGCDLAMAYVRSWQALGEADVWLATDAGERIGRTLTVNGYNSIKAFKFTLDLELLDRARGPAGAAGSFKGVRAEQGLQRRHCVGSSAPR